MVSEGDKQVSKVVLNEDQKKELAKKSLKKEIKSLLTKEAKWSHEPTAFDQLAKHEKPFNIEPFPHERERLPFKMSEQDRLRRKAWLHAQELTEREPIRVPELEKMIYNPIRRLYRAPTDRLFQSLAPLVGEHRVPLFRFFVPKLFLGYIGGCILWYQIKYNRATWEEKKGITMIKSEGIILPEEPKPATPSKWDYADRGFQSRSALKGSEYAY